MGKNPIRNEHLFCNPDGKLIHYFKKSFARLMEEIEVLYDSSEGQRVIYSLRHSCINNQIANSVDVYLIAKNVGTSVEMIEKIYGKARVKGPRMVDHITGSSRTLPVVDFKWPCQPSPRRRKNR